METELNRNEIEDPDYESVSCDSKREHETLSARQKDAKHHTIQRIEQVIRQQFSFEIHLKEREIELIDNRISSVRTMLDRLRACVLAQYYGTSQKKRKDPITKEEKGDILTARTGRSWVKPVEPSLPSISSTLSHTSTEKLPAITGRKNPDNSLTKNSLSALNDTETLVRNGHLGCHEASRLNSTSETRANADGSTENENDAFPCQASQVQVTSASNVDKPLISFSGSRHSYPKKPVRESNHWSATQVCGKAQFLAQSSFFDKGNLSNTKESHLNTERNLPNVIVGSAWNASGTPSIAMGNPLSGLGIVSIPTGNQSNDAESQPHTKTSQMSLVCTGSRFYVKKRIIVGNTSKYISIDRREDNDKSTHKWMVYVRGPPEDPHIDRFIKKVWFFLHPSYRPNDIVEVNKPPFHLTRRGWGEFPVRVQLHFVDPRNKRVDIIHELKLDRTYTGLQTLGAETLVDLELDRRTFEDGTIPLTLITKEESAHSNSVLSRDYVNNKANYEKSKNVPVPIAIGLGLSLSRHSTELELASQTSRLKKPKLELPISADSSAFPSAISTPVNSLPSSPCNSSDLKTTEKKFPDEIEELLSKTVIEHPLIVPERNLARHPYCAASLEQFLGWNIGKRRACEWQRAAAVKRQMSKCLPSCEITTKHVMIWCRRLGYTPSDKVSLDAEDVWFCKFCGGRVKSSDEKEKDYDGEAISCGFCTSGDGPSFVSFMSAGDLLTAVEVKEQHVPDVTHASDESEDIEIDVMGLEPVEKKTKSQRNQGSVECYIPPTLEQAWIRDACHEIGIKLKPLDLEGVRVHVIESLLWAACKGFTEHVLRHSAASAADLSTSYGPRVVLPSHVHKAVCSVPTCDFLRNMYADAPAANEKE